MAKVRQLPENTSSSSNVVATRSRSNKDGILHMPALPRRSSRLSSSVSFTNPRPKPSNRRTRIDANAFRKHTDCCYSGTPLTALTRDLFFQNEIKRSLRKFQNTYYYGPQDETRTCILSHGDTFSWTEKSSQSSWIVVDGTKTTCAVSMATRSIPQELEEAEWSRANGDKPYPILRVTLLKALSETIDSSGSLRKFIGQKHKTRPIAVVNLAPGTIGDHQETNEYQQALDAIHFLEAKLKHQPALTPPETLQIAVCALYYLCGPNFKSSEIRVRITHGWDEFTAFDGILTSSDVDKYLAILNETTGDRIAADNETSTQS